MTKYLILITILVLLYLYWKAQQTKTLPKPDDKPDDIIERKGKSKEIFDEAEDFDLSSDDSDNENQTVVNESKNENQTINGPKSVELPSAKFIPVRGRRSANTRRGFRKEK